MSCLVLCSAWSVERGTWYVLATAGLDGLETNRKANKGDINRDTQGPRQSQPAAACALASPYVHPYSMCMHPYVRASIQYVRASIPPSIHTFIHPVTIQACGHRWFQVKRAQATTGHNRPSPIPQPTSHNPQHRPTQTNPDRENQQPSARATLTHSNGRERYRAQGWGRQTPLAPFFRAGSGSLGLCPSTTQPLKHTKSREETGLAADWPVLPMRSRNPSDFVRMVCRFVVRTKRPLLVIDMLLAVGFVAVVVRWRVH